MSSKVRMLGFLILLFILLPVADLLLLIWLGERLGFLPTVALVVVTGVLGATLAKWQGLQVFRKLQAELAGGRMPGRTMFEGVLVLIAGALLITPGVITDFIGFAFLVPPVRWGLSALARKWAARRFKIVTVAPQGAIKEAEVYSVKDGPMDPAEKP